VILATGAGHKKLGIPGESRLAGMGVSYCATCDGAFFRGSDVAVIGGGDVAVEDAIFLARGCKRVYVVHRRDELRAAKVLQERLLALPNVEMVWNALPKSIEGESQVGALQVTDKFTGEVRVLHVDGVFVAVGIQPNNALAAGQLALDDGGYIMAGEDCKISVPGVYAVGDVRAKKLPQIITACGDGANAVTSVQEDLLTH
jgi:thioredoxin reductase (NADPH)